MKGQQESLTTVVIKQAGHPVPASSSTDGSRPGLSEVATRDGNWTTPAATDTGRTTQYQQGGKALSMQVWQTATVSTGAHRQKDGSMIDKLDRQVKSWATPRAEHDSGAHKGKPDTLHSQIKTWPTPASAGVTGGPTGLAGGAGNREKLARMLPDAEARAMGCGKLNPRWVETLMGLPVGWTMPSCACPVTIALTNCAFLVTESYQLQQP